MAHSARLTGMTVSSRPADGGRQAGDVGDLQLGHPGQLLELDPLDGLDVGLALAVGGDRQGQAAGGVPGDAAALPEQLGEVAEERQPLERVARGAGGHRAHRMRSGHRVTSGAPGSLL